MTDTTDLWPEPGDLRFMGGHFKLGYRQGRQDGLEKIMPLLAALNGLLERYTGLANSGDCGFWDPEKEAEVIAAREALK